MFKSLLIFSLLIGMAACSNQEPAPQAASATPDKPAELKVMPYAEEKAAVMKEMSKMVIPDEAKTVMKKAAEDLAAKLVNPGLSIGAKAPNFSLPNASGTTVSLQGALKSGPVVLVFYRGGWCPYCNAYLRALTKSNEIFKQTGASVLAVTPQQPDKSKEQLEKYPLPFPVLSDLDFNAIKGYQLYFELKPELHEIYKKFGIDLNEHNGQGRVALPVSATFVISRDGFIRGAEAHIDYKERMEPAKILEVLKKI